MTQKLNYNTVYKCSETVTRLWLPWFRCNAVCTNMRLSVLIIQHEFVGALVATKMNIFGSTLNENGKLFCMYTLGVKMNFCIQNNFV